ncbi:hypothetical protein KJ966_22350 [bacterium]|nr:hypothetical protein [bacterium]
MNQLNISAQVQNFSHEDFNRSRFLHSNPEPGKPKSNGTGRGGQDGK